MNVYRISWHDPNVGQQLRWHPSLAAAQKAKREVLSDYPKTVLNYDQQEVPADIPDVAISRCTIPLTKKGLLAWLNAHLTSDNG